MKYNELTLVQLKQIAKEKGLTKYSKLNKQDLIDLLNNSKKSKKQCGGFNCDFYIWCAHSYHATHKLNNKKRVIYSCKHCKCETTQII